MHFPQWISGSLGINPTLNYTPITGNALRGWYVLKVVADVTLEFNRLRALKSINAYGSPVRI